MHRSRSIGWSKVEKTPGIELPNWHSIPGVFIWISQLGSDPSCEIFQGGVCPLVVKMKSQPLAGGNASNSRSAIREVDLVSIYGFLKGLSSTKLGSSKEVGEPD